jgi:hypothetical protein
MKNLNEPHRHDDSLRKPDATREASTRPDSDPEVVPFQRARGAETSSLETSFSKRQVEELRMRWATIQTSFVDDPRKAVDDADQFVGSAIKQLQEILFAQRANLEKQWKRGDEVSTENLRVCMQNYRNVFDRLIAMTREDVTP